MDTTSARHNPDHSPEGYRHDPSLPPAAREPPPPVLASPADAPWLADPDLPWWRPGWQDVARQLGWRWVLLLPAMALGVGILAAILFNPALLQLLWAGGAKLALFLIALPVALAAEAIRSAVRARSEPFCVHCGYSLTGLPDGHRCPECGRPYLFALIDEYRRDPHWFIQRHRAHRTLPPADAPFAAGPVRSRRRRDGT